jgi:O-antigen/teichoic acid export membrane protein
LALLVRVLPYPPVTRAAIFWVGASLPLFAVTSAAATIFQAAERMKLVFIIEASTNLLILLLSGWMIWQQRTVEDLLRVVVVAQGVGMLLALALLLTRRLLAAPQRSSSLSWGQMLAGTMPFFGLSLTDVLLQRLDILLLSLFANPLLLGTYSAAYNLVRVGIKLIQSLWRAVYPTLARLYPTTPARARQVANMLLFLGIILCILVTLIATVSTTPILRLVYGLTVEANGQVEQESFALLSGVLSWLVWQVPLFFVELYATTWLLVVGREHAAFVTTLIHVILLALLLPIGAAFYGAMGAAWGTVAAQALGTVVAFWFMYRQRPHVRKA